MDDRIDNGKYSTRNATMRYRSGKKDTRAAGVTGGTRHLGAWLGAYFHEQERCFLELHLRHGYFVGGLFGASPLSVRSYFHSRGYKTTAYLSYEKLSQDVYEGAVIVFEVWNDKTNPFSGAHYMTAQYTNGQYIVYNRYSDDASLYSFGTLDTVAPNGYWIAGIIVG